MKLIRALICWYFGHKVDSHAFGHDGDCYLWFCHRCGKEDIDFYEAAGPRRYDNTLFFLRYWLFRKWFPAKCMDCGRRYKCNDSVEHIPF